MEKLFPTATAGSGNTTWAASARLGSIGLTKLVPKWSQVVDKIVRLLKCTK